MFEAYTSTFNGNSRKMVGFRAGFNTLQIGKIIYTLPTGSAENGGKYLFDRDFCDCRVAGESGLIADDHWGR